MVSLQWCYLQVSGAFFFWGPNSWIRTTVPGKRTRGNLSLCSYYMSLHLASVEKSCPATVYMLSLSLLPTINLNWPIFPLFSSHLPYKISSNQSDVENSGKERAALHIWFAASSADIEKEACGECFWMDRGSWYVHYWMYVPIPHFLGKSWFPAALLIPLTTTGCWELESPGSEMVELVPWRNLSAWRNILLFSLVLKIRGLNAWACWQGWILRLNLTRNTLIPCCLTFC